MQKKILKNNLILFIIFLFLASCSSVPKYPQNACKIFGEKYFYLKYTRAASKKWGAPISSILAVINKESGFRRFAKPKRTKLFKIIPYKRPSSSLGFSQSIRGSWNLYKKENNKPKITQKNVARVPMVKPTRKNIFVIEICETPSDLNIAISLVLFFTRIVRPEIILKAATIIIKDNIINITFLSTLRAPKND